MNVKMRAKTTNNTPARLLIMAWPEAVAMTDGGWYDGFLKAMKINTSGAHKAGHAAVSVINMETGEIHYSDFGRYIIPFGTGRARSVETDPDLGLEIRADIKDGEVSNLEDILKFMVAHEPFHGSGPLWATLADEIVSLEDTLDYIRVYQERGDVVYGPFVKGGSNCSRFVCDVAKNMLEEKRKIRQLKYPMIITPTPLGNIYCSSLGRTPIYKVNLDKSIETINYKWEAPSVNMLKAIFLEAPDGLSTSRIGTLEAPPRTPKVPKSAIWLAGLGAGAWFSIKRKYDNLYEVERRDMNGELEFKKEYYAERDDFDILKPYEVQYNTNARWAHVKQNEEIFRFIATSEVHSQRSKVYSKALLMTE